ncbi:hypothetical protein CsSME_00050303 [Camellia sinensis var. sinensis]
MDQSVVIFIAILTSSNSCHGNYVMNASPEMCHMIVQPLGDLGTLDVDEKGEAFYSDIKEKLRVADLIGRSIVVYGTEDKSDPGLTAAVIARSAGVGENYKKLCTCDGTTIWEATDKDFVTSKLEVGSLICLDDPMVMRNYVTSNF